MSVTGGSGFIGSSVVDALVGAGHDVRVLDPHPPHRDDVDWRDVDVLDLDNLTKELDRSGPVFHLAAMADVNDVIAAPARATEVNVGGTVNVLEAARQADAGRVILASTVWVYDATRGERVDETACFDPDTNRHLYVSTKIAAEMLSRLPEPVPAAVHGAALRHPVRPAHAPDHGAGVVLPPGAGRRDAAHRRRRPPGPQLRVRRGPRPGVRAGAAAEAENATFNLDGPEPVSIRRLAELTQELVPGALVEFGPSRPGDLAPRVVLSERAGELLDWTPAVDIDEGVRRTFDWYVEAHADELRDV